MGFLEAVKTALSKYATFSGRARRSEYWWFYLFAVLAYIPALVIDVALGLEVTVVTYAVMLGLIVPSLSVSVRRLHDTGRSGWAFLISLIPLFGPIWLLVVTVRDSEARDNAYGPWPKHTEPGPAPTY